MTNFKFVKYFIIQECRAIRIKKELIDIDQIALTYTNTLNYIHTLKLKVLSKNPITRRHRG